MKLDSTCSYPQLLLRFPWRHGPEESVSDVLRVTRRETGVIRSQVRITAERCEYGSHDPCAKNKERWRWKGWRITNEERRCVRGGKRRAAFEYQDTGAPINACRAPLGIIDMSVRKARSQPNPSSNAHSSKPSRTKPNQTKPNQTQNQYLLLRRM